MIKETQIFKALSDETRLWIISLLIHGELCVCYLENILKATQSKISGHLSYLNNSGFVSDRRENVLTYYSIPSIRTNETNHSPGNKLPFFTLL